MFKKANKYIYLLFISLVFCDKTVTKKVFHVFSSFGEETQELKNTVVMKYDSKGLLIDSTIYSHTLPLSEKYVYVTGPNEGLKLRRSYDKEMVLSYKFYYDDNKNRIITTLSGTGDSMYWKQYQKYDDNNKIIKRIRYVPDEAVNPEMIKGDLNSKAMLWGETFSYDSSGAVLEQKELYQNYVLVITRFGLDSLKKPIKQKEYFDPSVIFQTIFFHNKDGKLAQEISVGKNGKSLGSKTYEYDILGRRISTTVYNERGKIQNIYNTVFDDDNLKTYDYYSDSSVKLESIREVLLDNQGRPYVEALLDGRDMVLEKNVYYYDELGRLNKVKQYDMVSRGKYENREIPIRVNTYEYD